MGKILQILACCFLLISGANAQQSSSSDELGRSRERITSDLADNYSGLLVSKNALLLKAAARNIPVKLDLMDGQVAELLYFDVLDQPVYYKVMNVNAAKTTGTVSLQPGGELGVNLTGKGMVVGIYDQTRPKIDHIEYKNRLTQVDGSTETISTHATHVTGTIMAKGVSANARGMASEATGWAFNWEADLDKMNNNAYDPTTKPGGHLVSNHSYGVVLGWYRNASNAWAWAGNPSVSEEEDYRFGFYSSKSKGIDDLLFSKPYYTVVWAAGNDRSDSGDGTRDSDGPEDTIGPEGVAKNVITVGAVSNVPNYTRPSDVKMSDFSSWGPTDDGRIKPDIVGMGVSVFSSSVSNEGTVDAYATLSGTSMASPNVTGSLLLLQQLYNQRNNGKFMWSSTLKALAIHTTREAGNANGPDYVYGWGLLDSKAAGDLVLNENGDSKMIREENLGNGESFELELISDGVTPIKVSIAWTDPSGNPIGASLDPANLMLKNDLDLRITDEQGKVYFPWTLNPAKGPNAQAIQDKDNFRDNVEQISILTPSPQKYKIKVTHKGSLTNGSQDYSLILTAGTEGGASETLYWRGVSSGNWNDPANWSETANGPPANKIPDAETRVVFEGSAAGSSTVNVTADASAFSINLFGNQLINFDLNGNLLQVSNGLRVSNQVTTFADGEIVFSNSSINQQLVGLGNTVFANAGLNFVQGVWQLIDAGQLNQVTIADATLSFSYEDVKLTSLFMTGASQLDGMISSLTFEEAVDLSGSATLKEGIELIFNGPAGSFNNQSASVFSSLALQSGSLIIDSGGFSELAITSSEALINLPNLTVSTLSLGQSAVLDLGTSAQIMVLDNIISSATSSGLALVKAGAKGTLKHDIYRKYCFEYVNVTNVDLDGQAIINLGVSAAVINSSGWIKQACGDVLFAKFEASNTCVDAAVTFDNQSEGAVATYLWEFGNGVTSSLETPIFVYNAPGTYLVKLTISNSQGATSFEQDIVIGNNELPKPLIVINGDQLTSQQPSSSYQWYLNGQEIPGATQRSYVALADGSYQVAVFDASCNRLSDPVVISAIPEPDLSRFGIFIGPVPSQDVVNLQFFNDYRGEITLSLVDIAGRIHLTKTVFKNTDELTEYISLPAQAGLYLLSVELNSLILHRKVIKY